ncbi:pentapeptide repeat-containing protein [Tumidithrix elongata RA019]|uniref:Pentapeptide repeat-containing protein n=1 Tax=Tumidithrix elongata BACA0141 TaxID=2716417 RepID=A0AAW9Q6Y3_9CYAN|nr:pentapeptide repeat-containing protein [Tumidithrix elongata RA019]
MATYERDTLMSIFSLLPSLKKANLKISTTHEPSPKQRRLLGNWIWIVVIVVVIVAGRFLLFEVDGNPFQLPMKAYDWTGFGESYDRDVLTVTETATEIPSNKQTTKTTKTTERLQSSKTLWDWMSLLLAPATLASLGFLFQSSQEKAKRDKEESDKRRDVDQQREQALQSYFDQLSVLLVDKQLKKLLPDVNKKSKNEESNAVTEAIAVGDMKKIDADAALDVVKAKTMSLLRAFDQDMPRKASVLSFLGDSGLLIHLDLDLSFSRWEKANLRRADLRRANLIDANLIDADLSFAKLIGANLIDADLSFAKLIGANLNNADLSGTNLNGANLGVANLSSANLSSANLNGVKLSFAKLIGANLSNADLSNANLSNADLSNADLSGANLSNCTKLDIHQIKSAKGLESAIFSADFRAELDKFI